MVSPRTGGFLEVINSPESEEKMSTVEEKKKGDPGHPGPKYCLNIEGRGEISWPVSTVTMEQIAELGGWDPSDGVIQVDSDNEEHQLEPGEVVELKPGVGFCKKVRWKRG